MRQEFTTRARKEQMPDKEFAPQLGPFYDKEQGVQRRLTAIARAKDDFRKLEPEDQVKKHVAELQSEMTEIIHANQQTPEERYQVFLLKKDIVDSVLAEAKVDENREIRIKFRTSFLPPER